MSTIAETISLNGMDKAAVLATLYNACRPQGMGLLHYDVDPMSREEAQALLDGGQTYFDYLKGRAMKVDLSGEELNPWGYDRNNGTGAAETAISALKQTHDTNPDTVQEIHRMGRTVAAGAAIDMFSGGGQMAKTDFVALGKQKDRIGGSDTIASMIDKMSDRNMGATSVLMQLFDRSESGYMDILGLDNNRLYGYRIWELFKLCGKDIERFAYHIQMELPNQATGELSITGPYCTQLGGEGGTKAHFATRKYGKPGSFWAMEHPPTDPNFRYPIKIGADGLIEEARTITSARLLDAKELQKLTVRIKAMNPRTRRGFLDSIYASVVHGKTIFSDESVNGFRILLCRYGFQNHAMKLATGNYV